MSEIEVGEYIRDIDRGEILQVEKVWKDDDRLGIKFKEYAGSNTFSKDDLKRFIHSKNILDLIEDYDLIELEYYVRSKGKRIKRLFEVSVLEGEIIYFDNAHCGLAYDIQNNLWLDKGFNPKIISILTHEQYEANCYKVGDIE